MSMIELKSYSNGTLNCEIAAGAGGSVPGRTSTVVTGVESLRQLAIMRTANNGRHARALVTALPSPGHGAGQHGWEVTLPCVDERASSGITGGRVKADPSLRS